MTTSRYRYLFITVASVMLLSGCSYVPDKLNPIEWASDGYDWFLGEDDNYYSNSNLRDEMKKEQNLSGLTKCQGTDFMKWHNCEGTYKFANGDQYIGNWKNGKITGYGEYTWKNGRKYIGEFENGYEKGQGKITYPDGSIYVGSWNIGQYNGQGTLTLPNGNKLVGLGRMIKFGMEKKRIKKDIS